MFDFFFSCNTWFNQHTALYTGLHLSSVNLNSIHSGPITYVCLQRSITNNRSACWSGGAAYHQRRPSVASEHTSRRLSVRLTGLSRATWVVSLPLSRLPLLRLFHWINFSGDGLVYILMFIGDKKNPQHQQEQKWWWQQTLRDDRDRQTDRRRDEQSVAGCLSHTCLPAFILHASATLSYHFCVCVCARAGVDHHCTLLPAVYMNESSSTHPSIPDCWCCWWCCKCPARWVRLPASSKSGPFTSTHTHTHAYTRTHEQAVCVMCSQPLTAMASCRHGNNTIH